MTDKKATVSLLTDDFKAKIKELHGFDVDSDLLSPTLDYIFKRVFTADDSRSKIALLDLLNSLLGFTGEGKIVNFVVVNPEIPVDVRTHKKAIYDIRIKFSDGKQAVVEMQLSGDRSFKKRAQFIISKAYSSQDVSGEEYKALKKCYLICIVNFALFKDPTGLVMDYRFRDKGGKELTDDETIVFIQLPETDKLLDKPVETMTEQELWGVFFRHIPDESKRDKLQEIINRKEGIKMAANVLYEISQDEKVRIQYENELIAELDVRSRIGDAWEDGVAVGTEKGIVIGTEKGIAIGTEKGIAIGTEKGFNTALQILNELRAQLPVEAIASKYNLSVEQIERLRSTI